MIFEKRNAVPLSLFSKVKNFIEGDNFPWFYSCNTAYSTKESRFDELHNGSFGHVAIMEGVKNSEIAHSLEDCLLTILDSQNKKIDRLHRIRIGFIPISSKQIVNIPHVDVPYNHTVGLLYLNDSDGDTIVYNERFNPYGSYEISKYYEEQLNGQVTELSRFTPEENKFIMFDGTHYHSSSTPIKTKRRIAVNFVFDAFDR